MRDGRPELHHQLIDLEVAVLEVGELVDGMVGRALEALVARDDDLCRQVIADDDDIDARYLTLERRAMEILATQSPVATDLRLVSVILHINIRLERIGDQAVNVAKMALSVVHLPPSQTMLAHLVEMGVLVRNMIRTAMEALSRRDLALALGLGTMDDPVDRLNRGMCSQVVKLASSKAALEWGIRMNVVARQLERVGDNAVDIGEQVAYLITGEFREFTDASRVAGT